MSKRLWYGQFPWSLGLCEMVFNCSGVKRFKSGTAKLEETQCLRLETFSGRQGGIPPSSHLRGGCGEFVTFPCLQGPWSKHTSRIELHFRPLSPKRMLGRAHDAGGQKVYPDLFVSVILFCKSHPVLWRIACDSLTFSHSKYC